MVIMHVFQTKIDNVHFDLNFNEKVIVNNLFKNLILFQLMNFLYALIMI